MHPWQILKRAIPDGKVEKIARRLNVSADTVRRWRREPESDDSPLATGRTSPLDRSEDLLEAIFLENPHGAYSVARYPLERYEELAETLVLREPVKNLAAAALRDVVRAVEAINLDEPADEAERRVAEAVEAMNEVKRRVRVHYPLRDARREAEAARDLRQNAG
jgi:hypothetical protein